MNTGAYPSPSDRPVNRRVSIRRRGAVQDTATSSAADLALQQFVERRRCRNRYGDGRKPARSGVGRALACVSEVVGGSIARLGFANWGVRVSALVLVVAVMVVAVVTHGSREPPRFGLAGSVSFGGRPLAQAILEFHLTGDSPDREPFALPVETNDKGQFVRPPSAGVPPGRYAVVVRSGCVMPRPDAERGVPIVIPARYQRLDSTPFTVEVPADAPVELLLRR